jgi:hypothetical protein
MENGKWKMKEVFPFSVFRFPFSIAYARASALIDSASKLLKILDFWCRAFD